MSLITKHYPDRIEVLAYKNNVTEYAVLSKFNSKLNRFSYIAGLLHSHRT